MPVFQVYGCPRRPEFRVIDSRPLVYAVVQYDDDNPLATVDYFESYKAAEEQRNYNSLVSRQYTYTIKPVVVDQNLSGDIREFAYTYFIDNLVALQHTPLEEQQSGSQRLLQLLDGEFGKHIPHDDLSYIRTKLEAYTNEMH